MKSRVFEEAGEDAVIEAWDVCSPRPPAWAFSTLTKGNQEFIAH